MLMARENLKLRDSVKSEVGQHGPPSSR